MARISLYPHELNVVERLTENLVRLHVSSDGVGEVATVGPQIFASLLDALYARGNLSSGVGGGFKLPEDRDRWKRTMFQEVDK